MSCTRCTGSSFLRYHGCRQGGFLSLSSFKGSMLAVFLQCDNKRGNYALKEAKLASVWSNACGFNPKTTARGKSAVAWKSSGTEGAGNFSAVMYGVCDS